LQLIVIIYITHERTVWGAFLIKYWQEEIGMTHQKNYYRIMLGRKSMYAEECHSGKFIGADYGIDMDLTNKLPENWRKFNEEFIPIYLNKNPGKSKIAAGLSCGMLHTICKGIKTGDIVLCPNGQGSYWVGKVIQDYTYNPGDILPHRRGEEGLGGQVSIFDIRLPNHHPP
jgi:restriction system protein